ncbi:MAG: hypothetical protein SNF60_00155 [Rikenellaceae bacterium]
MQKSWRLATLTIVAILFLTNLSAQYYSWVADAPTKWREIKRDSVSVIYPEKDEGTARRTLHYIEAVTPYINYGFDYPALKLPYVLHTENMSSNGLVMWAPKRIDFITAPNVDGFSMPWLKQLVAHEYRHAVQYNNISQKMVKGLSYVFGQQINILSLALIPTSIIEGDAVLTETQFSSYGRGLQPSFTMGYRALSDELLKHKNLDYWFCGSYLAAIPDHYELGYQMASYTDTKYGKNIWNSVTDLAARRPYYLITTHSALKNNYNTSQNRLLLETFTDLKRHWDSLPKNEDSNHILSRIDSTNFTTYSHPIALGGGKVLSLKSDYVKPNRFILFDSDNGEEQRISYIGSLSTRPTISDGGRVWWSEYRRSKLFNERVHSQLCYMDLDKGKCRTAKGYNNVLYPTAISGNTLAYVEYISTGEYSIVTTRDNKELERHKIAYPTEIHGLAWDSLSERLYFLATDDSGMWLGVLNEGRFEQLRPGAYITLSDLRAEDGVLYFGSIASGLDEQHKYIVATGEEYQISQSRYGSFDPSAPKDGVSYGTTYNRYGYHLSRNSGSIEIESTPSNLPKNVVNPERRKWNIFNIDTVTFSQVDSAYSIKERPSKRYRKGLNLVNFHSWLPVAINPFNLIEEQTISANWGATLLSQNVLSSAEGYLSYGWSASQGSLINTEWSYDGLGVNLDLSFNYGGDQLIYKSESQPLPEIKKYYSLSASATLPLYYQRGYYSRMLSLLAGWSYNNGAVADIESYQNGVSRYNNGINKLSFAAGFYNIAKLAERDFVTPWGISLSAGYSLNPTNREFSDLISTLATIYTPGFAPHNSLSLSLCYQTSMDGCLKFQSAALTPHGVDSYDIINDNYIATSLKYQLPIWYPDGGISQILYFKRIRLALGADYAQFNSGDSTQRLYSYGGNLTFDFNIFRTPSASTCAISLSLYQNNLNGIWFGCGLELPF